MIPSDIASDPTPNAGPSHPPAPARWAVLYDPDCGFCRWSLAQLLALDRTHRVRPVALGTEEADRLLADLSPDQRAASWHLVSPAGERTSAGLAAVPLLRLLPGGRPPAALLAKLPGVTERTYRWVADHRSWFSRLIPDRAKQRADERIAAH
jgi:predicted DCC family thiol-disulfide oxidoreductase YuxK